MRPGSGQHEINGGDRVGAGVVNAVEIARASPRLSAIALAAFDYVMDMGTSRGDGTELFYARCAVLHAARVAGSRRTTWCGRY